MKANSSDSDMSIKEARKVLGKQAENLTDDEVGNMVAKLKYLAEGWLDTYERKIFKGKTLNELLTKLEDANL